MNFKIFPYYIVLFCCFIAENIIISSFVKAETVEKTSAFMGRHFIVSFMQNEIDRAAIIETSFLSIFVSSTKSDTVLVSIPAKQKYDTIYIEPYEIKEIIVETDVEVRTYGVVKNKQINIFSKKPITCWVYSSKNQSSDSYVAIPVSRWGKEYRIVSMPNDLYNGHKRQIADNAIDSNGVIIDNTKYNENLTPRTGEFLIIADLDSTIVTYIPTANTINGVRKNEIGRARLNKGDVLLVQSLPGAIGTEDLTGTYVSSNHPIGVLSGHVRSSVVQGLDLPYDTKDHLVEMLPSVNFWGRNFITIPFVNGQNASQILCASGDLIKVITRDDSTNIEYFVHETEGEFTTYSKFIDKGGSCFEIEANKPIYWKSDKPILVNQLMMHKGIVNDTIQESLYYDPSLVTLAPIEQFIESVTFATPRNNRIFDQYKSHCVIIVSDSNGIDNLYLDGLVINPKNSAVKKTRIGDSQYYWLMLDVKNGNHKLNCTNGNFSGIIYGHGYRDSYSMVLGSRLNDVDKPDVVEPIISYTDTCGNLKINVSDVKGNNTGIEWGEVTNKTYNFDVEEFKISDTTTVLNISAKPINLHEDALLEMEFVDKGFNKKTFLYEYFGFKVNFPTSYDFKKVNWITQTTAELKLKNNSKKTQTLLSIIQADDKRLKVVTDIELPYELQTGETIIVKLIFDPSETVYPFDTKIALIFECDFKIETNVKGEISSPGLIAQDINFGKIRLGSSKVLSDKVINAGNIIIKINEFENLVSEACFERTLNSNLPIDLYMGDSIVYTIIFNPLEIKEYKETTKILNNAFLDCSFNITGEAGSPNIENVLLDFGKHRLGTITEDTIYIKNVGNFNDTVNYKQDVNVSHINDASVSIIKGIKNLFIDEKDSIKYAMNFIPKDTNKMFNQFELNSSWDLHPPIYITIKGQGTIPVINTFDYTFEPITIYSQAEATPVIVSSTGNEVLTIDSIFVIDGDINSFEIDYNSLRTLLIATNDELKTNIIFKPTFTGEHILTLGVVHDANPKYERSIDTIKILGYATADNEKYNTYLKISELNVCNTIKAELIIENNSVGNLIIDSIKLARIPDIFEADFISKNIQYPIELEANTFISFPLNVYTERNQQGRIEIKVYYNGEVEKILTSDIIPYVDTIKSNIEQNIIPVIVGDTISLTFDSFIEQASEGIFDFEINIKIDKNLFFLLDKTGYIEFIDKDETKKIDVNFIQYDEYIKINLKDENNIVIKSATEIKFNFNLLVLLHKQIETKIIYEFLSDRCYSPGFTELYVEIQPVCGKDIRQVVFGDFDYLTINQNPISDKINYTINLIEDDIVDVIIFDINGRIILKQNKLELCKGKHNFIVDVNERQSSEYFIFFKNKNISKVKKIIIIK